MLEYIIGLTIVVAVLTTLLTMGVVQIREWYTIHKMKRAAKKQAELLNKHYMDKVKREIEELISPPWSR